MPCDWTRAPEQTKEERREEVADAVARLEQALNAGTATVKVGPSGSITFVGPGWKKDDRAGVSDLCAYRKLTARGSAPLRRALARAEAIAGRKVSTIAIGGGTHSHDGGHTWHPGHGGGDDDED